LFHKGTVHVQHDYWEITMMKYYEQEALGQYISLPKHILPVSQYGAPPKFNQCLFIGPLPTFPENFIQIHLEVSVQSC